MSSDFGDDCLTRNLYIVFKQLNYANGLRIIDEKANSHFNRFSRYEITDSDIPKVARYMNWDEIHDLYIPLFHISKSGKYFSRYNTVLNEQCIDIKKTNYHKLQNKDELFAKLDLIIEQHGL